MGPVASGWAPPPPSLPLLVYCATTELPCISTVINPDADGGALAGRVGAAEDRGLRVGDRLEATTAGGRWRFEVTEQGPMPQPPSTVWRPPIPPPQVSARMDRLRFTVLVELVAPGVNVAAAVLCGTLLADRVASLADGVVHDREAVRVYGPGDWREVGSGDELNLDPPILTAFPRRMPSPCAIGLAHRGHPRGARPITPASASDAETLASLGGSRLNVRDHVTVHVIDDEAPAGAWIHTHGLTKFGRPELELYDVPDALVVDATWAFHDFAAYLAGGALMRPGETLGDPARPMRVRHGGRDVDHWGSVPVLELVDLGPDQTPVDRGAPDGLEAWLRFEPGA